MDGEKKTALEKYSLIAANPSVKLSLPSGKKLWHRSTSNVAATAVPKSYDTINVPATSMPHEKANTFSILVLICHINHFQCYWHIPAA